ncbi:MAG: chorismate mutase [Phycisphaerales bacterium]|nr:chorismate mutase [Phycisphaerales bacterium]
MTAPHTPRHLSDLRTAIDSVDERLVALLAERARLVVEVGSAKRSEGVAVYAPGRERAVIERAVRLNPGPLQARTIEAVFREIMSGSFALERPLRIACLGPEGSFSHLAATRHFGSSVEHCFVPSIGGVFAEVASGHADHGMVPYENSSMGSIFETLDAFLAHDVAIRAEALVFVRLALLANCAPTDVTRIYSKPQVFDQCAQWCRRVMPNAARLSETSTSASVLRARDEPGAAAIASTFAGELHGVRTLFDAIEDRAGNATRFLILGREPVPQTGNDKTSMWFALANRPGGLVGVLEGFRREGINITYIEKRPSGEAHWDYVFFIDAAAHRLDLPMARALEEAERHCARLVVLGSYPQAQRPLHAGNEGAPARAAATSG